MNLILASKMDSAGMNIARHLTDMFPFEQVEKDTYSFKDCVLVFIEKDSIHAEFAEKEISDDVDFIIFASRHSSEAGVASLTVHTPGNFGAADFGGVPHEICFSNPSAQKVALRELQAQKEGMNLDFDVSMEATHHGPLTGEPTMFIEIGCRKEHWENERAGEAVAVSLMKATDYKSCNFPKAVGIGGGHYCQQHTLVTLYREHAVGHVIPKYVPVTEENVRKAVERNGGCDAFILDWKGTPERSTVSKMLEGFEKPILKARDILR